MYIHLLGFPSRTTYIRSIGQSKISKCGPKPLAITGRPCAEDNTRAGPTAAWIRGVYVQTDMDLAGIGYANLEKSQLWGYKVSKDM